MLRDHPSLHAATAVVAVGLLLAFGANGQVQATIVGAQSYGNELAGGEITVTYASGATHTEVIQDGGGTLGFASAPGFFDFAVDGDTYLADWSLTNLNTLEQFILLVEFDLTGAGVLFDSDGGVIQTPNGYAGRAGAVQVGPAPPTIVASFETDFWADPMNVGGDEWHQETIEYLAQDFRAGSTSVWRDDTDIIGIDTGPEVPEPTTLVLMLAACGGSLLRRRS